MYHQVLKIFEMTSLVTIDIIHIILIANKLQETIWKFCFFNIIFA
jgi:hypothetical protein